MHSIKASFSVLALALIAIAQNTAPEHAQLTPLPPKPTCVVILRNGACADLWRNYNEALAQRQREELQLYVNRQKEIASSQASAPLQRQIADLNKLVADQQEQIRKLQEQMQTDAATALQQRQADGTTALQTKSAAHTQGLEQGMGIGSGSALILCGIALGIRKLTRTFKITERVKAQSASA